MLNKQQKEFLVQELNRFTSYHNISEDGEDDEVDLEELSHFSLRRKRAILLEAITWCMVLIVGILVLVFKRRPLDLAAAFTFAVLTIGCFVLLLRAMYGLGRNRKFRLIVKLLRLNQEEKVE